MIDYSQDREALSWAEHRLGVTFAHHPATWLTSRTQDGTILGVTIFSRFSPGNCEITVASDTPRFISKQFAFAVAMYVFGQLECRRVTAIIAVDNEKSLSLAQRLGFRKEGTLRDWFPTSDAFILGLLREECSFLKDSHGRRLSPTNP